MCIRDRDFNYHNKYFCTSFTKYNIKWKFKETGKQKRWIRKENNKYFKVIIREQEITLIRLVITELQQKSTPKPVIDLNTIYEEKSLEKNSRKIGKFLSKKKHNNAPNIANLYNYASKIWLGLRVNYN